MMVCLPAWVVASLVAGAIGLRHIELTFRRRNGRSDRGDEPDPPVSSPVQHSIDKAWRRLRREENPEEPPEGGDES